MITDTYDIGSGTHEIRIAFARSNWTPELNLGQSIEAWLGPDCLYPVSISPASPCFASYDETAKERYERLVTSLVDAAGDRRFYVLSTKEPFASVPLPIAIDPEMRFRTCSVVAQVPPTPLSELDVFTKAISRINSFRGNGNGVDLRALRETAEISLLSEIKFMPVCWGAANSSVGFLHAKAGGPSTIIFEVGTSPPGSFVTICETDQKVELEIDGVVT